MTKTAFLASASSRAMFHAPAGSSTMLRGPLVAYAPDDAGGFSVDDAAAALRSAREASEPAAAASAPSEAAAPAGEAVEGADDLPAEETDPPHPESEAEPTAEEALDPETAIEGQNETETPERDPESPVIAAPQSWDATERATFATLPPQAQEIILKRETERDRAVSRAQQEAGDARKSAEAQLQAGMAELAQYKTTFDQAVTRANQVFAGKWENVDWVALARSDPAAYTVLKAEFDAEQAELQTLKGKQAEAARAAQATAQAEFQNYLASEAAALVDIAPHLAGAEATTKRAEVGQFLQGLKKPNGERAFDDQVIGRISAWELALAHDAIEYRKLKAAGKAIAAKPAPTPQARPAPAQARAAVPSAAAPTRTSQQRNVEAIKNRFAQTGSTDDAVALLRASRGAT
jgi:hypothetical protein